MKIDRPGPHLDHMIRQTRMHHVQLSLMADIKANALMTIAAVMITFSAPLVIQPFFRAAVIVLICTCLLTILMATFAVMPHTPLRLGKEPLPRLMSKPGFNLLFFGTFARLDYTQFEAAMEKMMNDPSQTYEGMVHDVYTLGVYLARKKYRFLRVAYAIFT